MTELAARHEPLAQDRQSQAWPRASNWLTAGHVLSANLGIHSQNRQFCAVLTLCIVATTATRPEPGQGARERILDTAYELFSHRGIHDVGVDELVARAGVAKATLYKHFNSKDELVLAFLERREQIWTYGWVEGEARRRGATAEEQLLAIFDLFDEWFHGDDFEGCSFIKVLLEFGDLDHPVGRASADYLENIRSLVRNLALEAGLRDPDAFALSWHILMKGSIVQAGEGDHEAAKRAKSMGRLLIDQHRLAGGASM
jgi:AcrR family transcriptional regulator